VSEHPRRESPAKAARAQAEARTQAKAARAQAEAAQAQADLAEAKVKVAKEQDAAIARALQEDDEMLAEVCSMHLYCLRLGRLIKEGMLTLTGTIAAIAKMNNTRKARQVIAEARDLLGGNGILLDFLVMQHLADIEAIHTYEGTETIQALIVGRDITGASAFA
jgi:alkylation response protein AidB-like acyl-CoA dehydrogenase